MSFLKNLFKKSKTERVSAQYNSAIEKLDSMIEQQLSQLYAIDNTLSQYKSNFSRLTESDMALYKKSLSGILGYAQNLANTINTTTNVKIFVDAYNALDKTFYVLEKHEFTGFFYNNLPSKNHAEIIGKKHYTEMDFLKRAYPVISEDLLFGADARYFYTFTEDTIKYIRNSEKAAENSVHTTLPIYGEYDSLIFEAGEFIIESNKCFIGMIQRKYQIGFNRAAKILDQLHDMGVIGEENGTQPRKILMSMSDFKNLKKNFKGTLSDTYSSNKNILGPFQNSQMDERVKMYNDRYDYMEGHDFEYFCAWLLRKNGFTDVEVTKGSGDQGIDITAIKDGVKYGIQCKCYSSDIGNKAVQEAFSGAKFYDCHVPVVLTNRHFTSAAVELAKKANVLLWDREYLNKLIEANN